MSYDWLFKRFIVGSSVIRHEKQLKSGDIIGFLVIFLTLKVSKVTWFGMQIKKNNQSYGLKFLV